MNDVGEGLAQLVEPRVAGEEDHQRENPELHQRQHGWGVAVQQNVAIRLHEGNIAEAVQAFQEQPHGARILLNVAKFMPEDKIRRDWRAEIRK